MDTSVPARQPESSAPGGLKKTYTVKPLVAPFGSLLFGELAILQCLERDGWTGVWVDTYHGSELFWRDMPHESSRIDLSSVPEALNLYRGIVTQHRKRGGFFDVFAWRAAHFLFIEYKGKGDRPNANEASFSDASFGSRLASTIRSPVSRRPGASLGSRKSMNL